MGAPQIIRRGGKNLLNFIWYPQIITQQNGTTQHIKCLTQTYKRFTLFRRAYCCKVHRAETRLRDPGKSTNRQNLHIAAMLPEIEQ